MARVVDGEVKEILDTEIEDTTPFIDVANLLVTKLLGSTDHTDAHLKKIELWLAAHFSCMRDNREKEVEADRSRATFEGETGMGLDYTRYGQMAKLLDTSGILAARDKASSEGRRQATITVAPREELE